MFYGDNRKRCEPSLINPVSVIARTSCNQPLFRLWGFCIILGWNRNIWELGLLYQLERHKHWQLWSGYTSRSIMNIWINFILLPILLRRTTIVAVSIDGSHCFRTNQMCTTWLLSLLLLQQWQWEETLKCDKFVVVVVHGQLPFLQLSLMMLLLYLLTIGNRWSKVVVELLVLLLLLLLIWWWLVVVWSSCCLRFVGAKRHYSLVVVLLLLLLLILFMFLSGLNDIKVWWWWCCCCCCCWFDGDW